MPRGSKPGERRGGRQKGTPNKKTVLRDAALNAAAKNPDLSPLDFLLGLMRDPTLPSALRIKMAEVAAPFVQHKPKTNHTHKYGALFKAVNAARAKAAQPGTPAAEATPEKQSPLDYLLSVMRDPNTEPEVRIRVARRIVQFVHPKQRPDRQADQAEAQLEHMEALGDEFMVDHELAVRLRDDKLRAEQLWQKQLGERSLTQAEKEEEAALKARISETATAIELPKGYGEEQMTRDSLIVDYFGGGPKNSMSEMELAVQAQAMARLEALEQTPERRARERKMTLKFLRVSLTAAEQQELDDLMVRYPEPEREPLPDDPVQRELESNRRWEKFTEGIVEYGRRKKEFALSMKRWR